ncbi:MAG: DUF72 domain-containing protein [Candidatus Lokiarchaeota archaeon]|nr:DUF72 domain-containing protein [Candidatus Lokiarchaeota archaeon]
MAKDRLLNLFLTHMIVMRKGLHIGTSGWSYEDDWVGPFYQSKKGMLGQYLDIFDTAEINSTFYSPPSKGFISYLVKSTPKNTFFTAKLPQKITHDHRLNISEETREILNDFFNRLKPISKRMYALLIQLPPWDIKTMGDLESFLSELDNSFRYAIEFRDESWLMNSTWELLEAYDIAHVIVDEPKLPIDLRITTDFSYIRWHGHGEDVWYHYLYTKRELEDWLPHISHICDRTNSVVAYFNNHFEGYAPFNALQMLQLLGKLTSKQDRKLQSMNKYFSLEQTRLDQF